MKTVVVGASSGLGRSIAIALGQRGASVALMARRHDRLVDAAKEAGPGSLAIECDVTDASSCRSAIEEAAAGLGGIDALLYSTGVGHLGRLVDADVDAWQRSFSTNVIGAALGDGGRHPVSDCLGWGGRVPLLGLGFSHTAVARTRGLHHQQGGSGEAGGRVPGGASLGGLHQCHRG